MGNGKKRSHRFFLVCDNIQRSKTYEIAWILRKFSCFGVSIPTLNKKIEIFFKKSKVA